MASEEEMLTKGLGLLKSYGLMSDAEPATDTGEQALGEVGKFYVVSNDVFSGIKRLAEKNPKESYESVLAMTILDGRGPMQKEDLLSMTMVLGSIPLIQTYFNNLRRKINYIK